MIFLLSISSLLLRKQHHQKSKPRSLLQKSSLERYLKLLTKIKSLERWKFFNYSKMIFLAPKRLLLRN